jgi:hypothetical protein
MKEDFQLALKIKKFKYKLFSIRYLKNLKREMIGTNFLVRDDSKWKREKLRNNKNNGTLKYSFLAYLIKNKEIIS